MKLGVIAHVSESLQKFAKGNDPFEAGARLILKAKQTYVLTKERRETALWKALIGAMSSTPADETLERSFGQVWRRRIVGIGLRTAISGDDLLETIPCILKLGRTSTDHVLPSEESIRELLDASRCNGSIGRTHSDVVVKSGSFEAAFSTTVRSRRLFLTDHNRIGILIRPYSTGTRCGTSPKRLHLSYSARPELTPIGSPWSALRTYIASSSCSRALKNICAPIQLV
jgi:hypothetical protein